MSTAAAKNYALTAQKSGHPNDKLDYLAKAIFEIASALEELELARKTDQSSVFTGAVRRHTVLREAVYVCR